MGEIDGGHPARAEDTADGVAARESSRELLDGVQTTTGWEGRRTYSVARIVTSRVPLPSKPLQQALALLSKMLPPLARGIIVRIGRLLRRTHLLGHMTQIDANARPRRRAAAHRINEHVVDREM